MTFRAILSPLGIDFFCFGKKFLVYNLISRNLKIKYRRSIIGYFWSLLGPLAVSGIYYFVFKIILKIPVAHYPVFLLAGVLFWTFFSQSLLEGMESIVGNWGLLSKVPIPLQIFPYVGTLTNLVTLILALPVLMLTAVLSGLSIGIYWLFLPVYFLQLFLVGYSCSFLLAVGFVYFRDLRHMLNIFIQIWFYSTPVLYDEKLIPEAYRHFLYLNPVGHTFTGIHHILLGDSFPPVHEWTTSMIWCVFLVFISSWVHIKLAGNLVENI